MMELLLGFPSTHARQIIQSFLPARPKKKKKKRGGGDALNANGKIQLLTNLVWRSNAHTAVRKTSSKKKQIYIYEKTQTKQQQQQQQQQQNKKQTKWGTGAVQDKPFDELLMFIVDKDSALFSGL